MNWIRCPKCGDSKKHLYKKHCAIYDDGSTYCFRCQESSKLSIEALLAIALGDMTTDEVLDGAWDETSFWPAPSTRFTRLQVYLREGFDECDSFQMRKPNGDVVGWHDRTVGSKTFTNEGHRGLGFVGSSLTSSPSSPLVVVEGPYDVITDRHVCLYGAITKSSLRRLRLQHCWLHPDPDMVSTAAQRMEFVSMARFVRDEYGVFIYGYILSNGDPDECTQMEHIKL